MSEKTYEIEAMAEKLQALVADYPQEITTHAIQCLGDAYVSALNANAFVAESADVALAFRNASGHALGHILTQALGHHTGQEFDRSFREKALDAAQVVGPDHGQTLYKFAVLVTKLT